nr:venom protein [Lampona murina]
MKTSFAFALLFVTLLLISMIYLSHEKEIAEYPEQARDCAEEGAACDDKDCCSDYMCLCKGRPPSDECFCGYVT